MIHKDFLFTSESVSDGHPDKVADRISDTVLDTYLSYDPYARVACETLVTTNKVVIAGEVRGPSDITPELLIHNARMAIKDIGYEQDGFHWKNANVDCLLHAQSVHIAQGVDSGDNKDEGAGDQGIMFGYATNETEQYMPAPLFYAHKILKTLKDMRTSNNPDVRGLLPDAKSQVTLLYSNGIPVDIDSVVVSTQHEEFLTNTQIYNMVNNIIDDVFPEDWAVRSHKLYVNPTGKFVIGGPDGDCGLTGRKIIVDTYGGAAPHGGGAFSGKDPTKVDRSAAYAARWVAKNVVAAGLADKCTIQLAYAIGVAKPLALYFNLHDTAKDIDENKLAAAINDMVDLSPRGIRTHLRLNRPIYSATSAYGHFGRTPDVDSDNFTWENLDLVHNLRNFFNR
jgi:S-adenosylmethionine synthetase